MAVSLRECNLGPKVYFQGGATFVQFFPGVAFDEQLISRGVFFPLNSTSEIDAFSPSKYASVIYIYTYI